MINSEVQQCAFLELERVRLLVWEKEDRLRF